MELYNSADISYVNHMYSTVKIGPGTTRSTTAKGVARTVDMVNTDISCIFHVLDLSNGGDVQGDDDTDICFNIIAAFQIYAKYNHVAGTSTQVWPQEVLVEKTLLQGMFMIAHTILKWKGLILI